MQKPLPVSHALIQSSYTGQIDPPFVKQQRKLKETANQWSKTTQSVPSIPTGNKMLLLSAEEEEDQ